MAHVRRGGRARTPLGELVTWTLAEGERGTRWRESMERDGQLIRSLLLEVSPAGRPTRLELTTRAGLLTLHPEADESAMHGNVVSGDGVRHLAFEWGRVHQLLVVDSPASAAVSIREVERDVMVGASTVLDVLRVGDDLDPRQARWRVERIGDHDWQLRDGDGLEERRLTVDDDGRPVLLDEVSWPLEL